MNYDTIRIGKFDILCVYTYCKHRLAGADEESAKTMGYVVAVMGAQAKMGFGRAVGGTSDTTIDQDLRRAAEGKKNKGSITSAQYDKQVAKMGSFYEQVFLPRMMAMARQGLKYDQVKSVVEIPATFGAKVRGPIFVTNTEGFA